jgi:hypothetical protein
MTVAKLVVLSSVTVRASLPSSGPPATCSSRSNCCDPYCDSGPDGPEDTVVRLAAMLYMVLISYIVQIVALAEHRM